MHDHLAVAIVYAQLEQRVKRDHGVSFDKLVRSGRAQLDATRPTADLVAV